MNLKVVLPTYNERPNIDRVLEGILQHPWASVLVVDDQSPDGTGEAAEALAVRYPGRVEVLYRTGPRGLGLAYVAGLRRALASDVEAIGQMDADLSHDPSRWPELMKALVSKDVVVGSRYTHGVSVVNWPIHRLILSTFANRYIRLVTGLGSTDCTSGFRVWRREALARIRLDRARASGYALLTEMLYEAAEVGCRLGEVPIIFTERERGHSKLSIPVLIESFVMPWRLLLRSGRLSRKR